MTRHIWYALGLLAIGAAMVGVALPIMPTVPFLLLAAFCFARSNPELAARLYNDPRYGPALRAWRDHRAIARKAKISSILAMSAGVAFTWYVVGWPWVAVSLAVLLIVGPWIWTRPE